MIKVTKDLNNIPQSLIPAFADLFPGRIGKKKVVAIPATSRTTHKRRMEVIEAKAYIKHDNYNSRYKLDDVKNELQNIYKGKCAFCEQKEELTHVEHFRPKDTYYWLAFSWDNLLMSCPTCNAHKGTNFEIDHVLVSFMNTELNIRSINCSSATYDINESPRMINPEVIDPKGLIHFEKDGRIRSDDHRFSYTIDTCKLDRKSLNDRRRSLLDRFREHVRDVFIVNSTKSDQEIAIKTNFRNFVGDSMNDNEDFLAFRQYAIASGWINDIIKEMN